jgi:NAD(P)-dependent dehydrogenase (short-subunit alcohol dehydrogenase family)
VSKLVTPFGFESTTSDVLRGVDLSGKTALVTGANSGIGYEAPTPLHSQPIAHWGACGKTRVVPQNGRPRPEPAEMGAAERVCCCRCMGGGDVEPLVGLAVRLRALGVEVRVCAQRNCTEQLAGMQPCRMGSS